MSLTALLHHALAVNHRLFAREKKTLHDYIPIELADNYMFSRIKLLAFLGHPGMLFALGEDNVYEHKKQPRILCQMNSVD